MKFSLIALAGALTVTNAASSVVPKTFKLNGKRNLRRGDVSTEALLQKAVPYNRKNINRHLQEEDDAAEAEQGEEAANDAAAEEAADDEEEAAVEPSSASTISFGKCVDVKTKDENLFSEDLIEQVQAGNVMSLKSYVLFDVCNDTYGYGCSESNSVEYMVDLATYLSVVGLKQANQRTDYCEQCNRFQDSCAAAAEEEEEEQAAYDEEAVDEEQEGEEEQGEQEEEQADAEEAVDEEQEGEEEQGEQEEEQADAEEEQEGSMDQQEQGEQEQEQGSKDDQQEQGEQEFEEQKEEQNAQAYEMANGGRKLKEQINCNKCESLQCFADDAENGQADIDTMVAEWIEEVANCKATDQYVNGMQVYLGPICSDGQYFEIGAFLNEDCTIHTNLASFSEIAAGEQDNYDVDVAGYAISALKAAVYEPMTCESQEFADVNEEEEEEENEEENNEMNDYCKQLFQGEQSVSVKFSDCAAAEEEEQDEEQEEEEADEDYSWYSYDMEEADDIEKTCSKVVSFNGVYTRYYDSSVNGTIHENESSVSVFGIAAIVVACVAAIGLVASSSMMKKKQSPVLLDEPIYQGGQMS